MENPRQINAGGGKVKTDRIAETKRRTRELVERLINKRYYSGKGKERGGNGEGTDNYSRMERRVLLVSSNTLRRRCTLHDVRLHLVRFHLTQTVARAASFFHCSRQKPGARASQGEKGRRDTTTERVHIARRELFYVNRIIPASPHYNRL